VRGPQLDGVSVGVCTESVGGVLSGGAELSLDWSGGGVSGVLGGVVVIAGGVVGDVGGGTCVVAGGVVGAVGGGLDSIGGVVVGGITPGAELAGTGELCVATGNGNAPVTGATATATGGAGLLIGALTVWSPLDCTGHGSEYEPSQHGPDVVCTGVEREEVCGGSCPNAAVTAKSYCVAVSSPGMSTLVAPGAATIERLGGKDWMRTALTAQPH
jgi:hypothetical protein